MCVELACPSSPEHRSRRLHDVGAFAWRGCLLVAWRPWLDTGAFSGRGRFGVEWVPWRGCLRDEALLWPGLQALRSIFNFTLSGCLVRGVRRQQLQFPSLPRCPACVSWFCQHPVVDLVHHANMCWTYAHERGRGSSELPLFAEVSTVSPAGLLVALFALNLFDLHATYLGLESASSLFASWHATGIATLGWHLPFFCVGCSKRPHVRCALALFFFFFRNFTQYAPINISSTQSTSVPPFFVKASMCSSRCQCWSALVASKVVLLNLSSWKVAVLGSLSQPFALLSGASRVGVVTSQVALHTTGGDGGPCRLGVRCFSCGRA